MPEVEKDIMDDAQEDLSQDVSGVDEPVEGEDQGNPEEHASSEGKGQADDPYGVKRRLGQQAKKHQREMRQLKDQLSQMQQMMAPQQSDAGQQQMMSQGGSAEDQIQMAVRAALGAREEQERKAQEAERMAHVHRQYQRLNDEFDNASEKYEDFDQVVRGDDAPFTHAMRDALLMIDNPADVAYKLGKNREELLRISKLHPLDQAREVNKLSFALMGGTRDNGSSAQRPMNNPMGKIKANPVNNSSANQSAAAIRAKMKAGNWK